MAATTSDRSFPLSCKLFLRDADNRVLLLLRSANSGGNPLTWDFPGGKVDSGESFDQALAREVREETGLSIALERPAGSASSELPDRTIVYLFMEARRLEGEVCLSSEHTAHCWLTLTQLADLAVPGDSPKDHGAPYAGHPLAPQFRAPVLRYCASQGYGPTPDSPGRPATVDPDWLEEQVKAFTEVHPRFEEFAKRLAEILDEARKLHCPLGFVGARAKDPGHFARKIAVKNKYQKPLEEITDLAGARIITQTLDEIEPVCQFIRHRFKIDEKNSLDARDRLKAGEFGYRSVHYVVSLDPKQDRDLPEYLYGLKAEIQVRTILQHAWSDIGHDRLYKSGFAAPEVWERESARIAAMIESADEAFTRLVKGIEEYRCNFGAYLDKAELARQIAIEQAILRCPPGDQKQRHTLARMLIAAGRHNDAVNLVNEISDPSSGLLVCKGIALCSQHRADPNHPGYREALECFRRAIERSPTDVEPRVQLASAVVDADEKLRLYDEAFNVGPSDPGALLGYIRQRILVQRSVAFLPLLRPEMEAAIRRCEQQASVRVNLPWSLYSIAAFRLLLAGDDECVWLDPLCRAVKMHQPDFLMDGPLKAAHALKIATDGGHNAECALRFITAARRARFPDHESMERVQELATKGRPLLQGPLVIVAGGCDKAHANEIAGYAKLIDRAFAEWRGTILSGGTQEGISGLVAGLGTASNGRIHTVGYLPEFLPADGTASVDNRYHELRRTDGRGFSALEPIRNWIDILASGIDPSKVRLLGINGGRIAAMEFRIAWGMGAEVAVVRGSGREADRVERDLLADQFPGMLVLPPDWATVRAFLRPERPGSPVLTSDQKDRLARFIHARFLEENRHKIGDPAMQPWEYLDPGLRQSNLDQVAYTVSMLHAAHLEIRETHYPVPILKLTDREIEILAELEHGRWNVERLKSGWRWGEKRDVAAKVSPYLVGWERLEEVAPAVKEWDRSAVRRFPAQLAEVGLEVFRRISSSLDVTTAIGEN